MFENTKPLVTTFTLCYHTKARFVIEAIDAIQNQTYKNIEHIIINDAPDDLIEWPKIKKHIIDNRYNSILIEHTQNQGIANNLNEITICSKGHYIAGCSDDLWEPTFIENQVEYFLKQKDDVAVVFGDIDAIDENNNIIKNFTFNQNSDINNTSSSQQLSKLLAQNFVITPASIWKREAVINIGMYSQNQYAEDYQMWYKLLLNGYRIKYNPISKVKYRKRTGAVSNTYESSGKMALDRCRLFHQTKAQTPEIIWQAIEPVYYKFVKRVIQNPNLNHQIKRETIINAVQNLSYLNRYLLWFIVSLKLYKFKLIRTKIG